MSSAELAAAPPQVARRSYLAALLGLASTVIGALLVIPVLRYVLSPLRSSTAEAWTPVGTAAQLAAGPLPRRCVLAVKRRDGWRELESQPVVYVIEKNGALEVLSATCPHLGCTVPWVAARAQFVCPCHGGVFSADGTHVSGPPPRSLDALESKLSGGTLLVKVQSFRPDVSKKEVTG